MYISLYNNIDMVTEEAIRVNEITEEEINLKTKPKLRKALNALWTSLLVVAVVVAIPVTYVDIVYTAVYIDGQSMAPTLNNGFAYSTHVEFGLMDERPKTRQKLKRGDIIVFDKNGSVNGNPELLIKRVIALPLETILITNDQNADTVTITNSDGEITTLVEDYLTDTNKQNTAKDGQSGNGVSVPLTLGENEYYLMGDNRANSHDSRDLGAIASTKIRGKLVVIQGYAEDVITKDGKLELVKRHYYLMWKWRFY